jgi:hypothetical protein
MPLRRLILSLIGAAAVATLACNNDDLTGSGGSLARIAVNAPNSVASGDVFTVEIDADNIGFDDITYGSVDITMEPPLQVVSLMALDGTSATFTGGTIAWTLNTIDPNSNRQLLVQAQGVLAAGAPAVSSQIRASMVGEGIGPGELVTTDSVVVNP